MSPWFILVHLGSSWFILVHLHSFRFLILFLIIVLVVFMRVLVACLKSGEAIAQSFPAKASPRRVVTVAPKTYCISFYQFIGNARATLSHFDTSWHLPDTRILGHRFSCWFSQDSSSQQSNALDSSGRSIDLLLDEFCSGLGRGHVGHCSPRDEAGKISVEISVEICRSQGPLSCWWHVTVQGTGFTAGGAVPLVTFEKHRSEKRTVRNQQMSLLFLVRPARADACFHTWRAEPCTSPRVPWIQVTSVAVSVNLPLRAIEDSTGKEGHYGTAGWVGLDKFSSTSLERVRKCQEMSINYWELLRHIETIGLFCFLVASAGVFVCMV